MGVTERKCGDMNKNNREESGASDYDEDPYVDNCGVRLLEYLKGSQMAT